jgi:hypothetical protein
VKRFTFIAIVISFFWGINGFSQGSTKTYFAIGFFTSNHSQLVTYAFINVVNGHATGAEVIRKDRFIYSALGHWPSKANPEREDLFMKYNVDSVFLVYDHRNKVVGYYEVPFEHLWKIRFKENPFKYDEFGWSNGLYKPSAPQQEFLRKEYGINNILTDYIYGDSLFKLLRDMQKPSWVSSYRTATIADSTATDTTASPNP